jgi:hypothetical protein
MDYKIIEILKRRSVKDPICIGTGTELAKQMHSKYAPKDQ